MGKFITFEGCEGAGKSTQLRFLQEYCQNNGIKAIFTREPGGSEIAEQIRRIILSGANQAMTDICEAYLYAAARNQHISDVIKPALLSGAIVFCDRYIHSSYAYQGYARGLGIDVVREINKIAVMDFMPDYTVFLDYPPYLAFSRKGGADKSDRMETQEKEFHEKVYCAYKQMIKDSPEKILSIDAQGTKQETFEKVLAILKQKGVLPV